MPATCVHGGIHVLSLAQSIVCCDNPAQACKSWDLHTKKKSHLSENVTT